MEGMISHRRLDLRVPTGPLSSGRSWTLAITVHLPQTDRLLAHAPVLVSLPGGGYNRRYYDLKEPGYSEAAHHTARGFVVIAIDHLRVGESDLPDLEQASLEAVAEANHAAVQAVLARLRAGEMDGGVAPINPSAVVGEGQSMGGHIALIMQARHASFDGLAILGASVVCTRLRAPAAQDDICLLGKSDPAEGLAALRKLDWRHAFHWDDVPEQFAGADDAAMRGGPLPYWRSATTPEAGPALLPGYYSRDAASITVPVLIGMGERDVCQDPLRELAAYMSTRDLALFVGPRMGHMHNFAGTRDLLWRRVAAFVGWVTEMSPN